jgi:hypothetical protein
MLLKCPSKYKDQEVYVREKGSWFSFPLEVCKAETIAAPESIRACSGFSHRVKNVSFFTFF